MNDKQTKDSNELLNFLMIIIGALFILKAITELLAWAGFLLPWLTITPEALSVFGSQGIMSILLGFWCLVAGIGLFREEEYALGMGLVVLSIMAAAGITAVIAWIGTPASFDASYWPNYITIVATIVGVVGFLWLVFTYKRYD